MAEGYSVKVRPEKVATVERIKAELDEAQTAVLTEYRGLTVPQLKELRNKLRDQDASYKVEKNTLARRAVAELGFGELEELLAGPVAIAYVRGDPVAAAKVLAAFAREHPDLLIKGGVLEGRVMTAEEAKDLARVDTLDVSRAKIAGLLEAPIRQLMFLLEAPAARILYVLEQLGSRGAEEAAPTPEPQAEAPVAETEAPAAEAEPDAPVEAETPEPEVVESATTEDEPPENPKEEE